MLSLTSTIFAACLCLTIAVDCASRECDDTSLVQVRRDVRKGRDRADETRYPPYWGAGFHDSDVLAGNTYFGNAAEDAYADGAAAATAASNYDRDVVVNAAGQDGAAADYKGLEMAINGADENDYVNSDVISGRDDAAAARTVVADAVVNDADAARSYEAANRVHNAEAVAAARTAAAANNFAAAAATEDENEVHAAEAMQVANAERVATAVSNADAAWTAGAEKNAYADVARGATAEKVINSALVADAVKDVAKATHGEADYTATALHNVNEIEAAVREKAAKEVHALEAMSAARARANAQADLAANTAAVKSIAVEAQAAKIASLNADKDDAKAAFAYGRDVATTAQAVRDFQVSHQEAIGAAATKLDAEEVANTQAVAIALRKAEREDAAAMNAAAANRAKDYVDTVSYVNKHRKSEVETLDKALAMENAGYVSNVHAYANANAKYIADEKSTVDKVKADNANEMAAIVNAKNKESLHDANVLAFGRETMLDRAGALAKVVGTEGSDWLDAAKTVDELEVNEARTADDALNAWYKPNVNYVAPIENELSVKSYITSEAAPAVDAEFPLETRAWLLHGS